MSRIILFCFVGCLFLNVTVVAQSVIYGTVVDKYDNPLDGANIVLKGKGNVGTVTDNKGRYSLILTVKDSCTLLVTYIGYKDVERKIYAGQGESYCLDFVLHEDARKLNTFVVTGTRTPKLLKDVPIVTRVITNHDIEKVDATDIEDVLQSELPGLEFTYSMNQQVSLNMQGFGGNSVLFLVDGERMAGETLDNVDYSRLNMQDVERIEIVKGAASSLYGSNAVGGVVNIISKTNREPWSLNLRSRFGAFNEQIYGALFGFNKGRLNATTSVQYTSIDSINLKNEGVYNKIYGNKTWNIKERMIFRVNDDLKFTARAGYFFRERNSSEIIKERYRDFNGGLKGDYDICDDGTLEVSYSFDQYDKSDYHLINDKDIRDYSNVQNVFRTVYSHTFYGRNILTVGADYMNDYLMSYQFENGGNKRQNTIDAFAQFDWKINERLNIISALRADYYSESESNQLSPKIGLMYKFFDCSLRALYSRGFRSPTLKEMYMTFDMANIFMIYGNPELESETSHNFSLSAEYPAGHYNLIFTAFQNLMDNRITTVWNQALNGMVYANMSPMSVCGLEANISVNCEFGLSASLSYAYTYEKMIDGTPLMTMTRPHAATVRVEYGKEWKKYEFSCILSGRLLSELTTEEYVSMTSYEQTVKQTYPAYMIWKLTLLQRIYKGANLTMSIDNLFNYIPDYYYSNSPSTVGATFSLGISIDVDKFFK